VGIYFPEVEEVNVSVTATNTCGSNYTFVPHRVDVISTCENPQIKSITSISGAKLAGSGFTLTVSATGTETLTYVWKKNGSALADQTGHIAGQGTSTLVMSNLVAVSDNGTYTCEVSNAGAAPNCNYSGGTDIGSAGTVTVMAPQAGDAGKGKFTAGETCFDVNAGGNSNTACGTTGDRASSAMDLSKTYTYTFQHVTANKSLQFLLEGVVGAVEAIGLNAGTGVSAVTAGAPDTTLPLINAALAAKTPPFTAGSSYSITLKFRNTLNQQGQNPTAYGTTSANPVVVTLSALYEDNASTIRLENRVISIKDCSCCGTSTTPGSFIYNGITYKTGAYVNTNANLCWMLDDSQIGTVSYWCDGLALYAHSNKTTACPPGWRLPTAAEYNNGWSTDRAVGKAFWPAEKQITSGTCTAYGAYQIWVQESSYVATGTSAAFVSCCIANAYDRAYHVRCVRTL
jgi:hypothetical protein